MSDVTTTAEHSAARTVWLFFATWGHPHMPVGVWSTRAEAEAWIACAGATGTLAECTVGTSAWDDGIRRGTISVPPALTEPHRLRLSQRFECEPVAKFYFRDGTLIDLTPSTIDTDTVELRMQFRELIVVAQALNVLANSTEFCDAEFPTVYMMSREQIEVLADAVWKVVHQAARMKQDAK